MDLKISKADIHCFSLLVKALPDITQAIKLLRKKKKQDGDQDTGLDQED